MASSSKTFLLLGFMFALVILISSEVSARKLVEITKPAIPISPPRTPTVKCSRFRPCLPPQRPYRRPRPYPSQSPPPPPPKCNPYIRNCFPPPGEYRHGQEHHEKPGSGVAEIETGN